MPFEKILKLLGELPAEQAEQKSQLLELVKSLNQEKGKASADILKFKKELDAIKGESEDIKKQNATYQEIASELSKLGIDAKNADELMAKLNIKKSLEDENVTLKSLLEQTKGKLGEFETKEQQAKRMEKINPLFSKAMEDFVKAKQTEGKVNYRLTDTFVDKNTLYKEVDIDNDTLRNDHFTKVLQAADVAQQKFIESTGMDYTRPVHGQNMTQGHYQKTDGIANAVVDGLNIVKQSGGSMDSVIQGLARVHAAEKAKS